jgi:Tfp pilus assembly PilM family ATPase
MHEESEKEIMVKLSALMSRPASTRKIIRCADCNAKNPPQRIFCGKCGKHLWEPCLNCGESNLSLEEFCGNCGVRLQTVLQDKTAEFDAHLETADKLYREDRFHEAISILKPVATAVHSHLAERSARAKQMMHDFARAQMDWSGKIRKIEEDLPGLLAAGNVVAVIERIRRVPETLRTPELSEILQKLEGQQTEIAELCRAIAPPEGRPLTLESMHNVARLLELQPNHEAALKQAGVMKRGVMRKSKAIAQTGDFEKAWEILAKTPEVFRDDEFRVFREQIGDFAYYARDIEHHPHADSTLFEYARRLRKILPDGSPLKHSCDVLAERERERRQNPRTDRRWTPATPSPFGAPMEFLVDFGAIRIASGAETVENPGRFAPACGLALQGLGVAPLSINLLPQGSWRERIGRWMSKRSARAAWGVEIGASGIKAVRLEITKESAEGRAEEIALTHCRILEHRRRLMQSTNEKERDSLLEETLKAFGEQQSFGDDPLVLGLPDWMVLLKAVELPPMPESKREAAIEFESQHLFASPMRDIQWKHVRFDDSDENTSPDRPFSVSYIGVRERLLRELLERWSKSGLKAAVVQCDMAALYNFAMYSNSPGKKSCPTAYIDLGANRLNVLVASSKRIWHRSVMFGSDQINKTLVREFKLTYSQAEEWKRNPTLAPSPGKLFETLRPIYDVYVHEVLDSLDAYRKAFPEDQIAMIVGCGGGFAAHDLPRYFAWRK